MSKDNLNHIFGKLGHTKSVDEFTPEQLERIRRDAEWTRERVRLQGAVTRAYNAARMPGMTLAAKLEALKKIDELREQLRQHKLNYHELTAGQNEIRGLSPTMVIIDDPLNDAK